MTNNDIKLKEFRNKITSNILAVFPFVKVECNCYGNYIKIKVEYYYKNIRKEYSEELAARYILDDWFNKQLVLDDVVRKIIINISKGIHKVESNINLIETLSKGE